MKLLRNIIFNSYIQIAMLVSAFGYLISYLYGAYPSALFKVYLGFALAFITIGIFKELLYIYKNKSHKYHDLAKLLIITKKIEKGLEEIGGFGKGMYEKAESLGEHFPKKTLYKLLKVAEARNNAMHGNPQIKNSKEVMHNARDLYKEIKSYAQNDFYIFYRKKMVLDTSFFLAVFSLLSKSLLSVGLFVFLSKYLYLKFLLGGVVLALIITFYIAKYFIFNLNKYLGMVLVALFSLLYSGYLAPFQELLFQRIF